MQTIDDLLSYIDGRFSCVEGLPTAICQSGDPYVVVGWQIDGLATIPGTINAGARRLIFPTRQLAILGAKCAFDRYADGRRGTVYWRSGPRIETATTASYDQSGLTKYASPSVGADGEYWAAFQEPSIVYMRLVISERPVIYQTLADFHAKKEAA